jgi:hypothetical protein
MNKNIFKFGLVFAMGLFTSVYADDIDACKDQMGHEGSGKVDNGRDNQSATGNVGSSPYHYEIWYQGGSNSMTSYDNGTFTAKWSGTNDFLARVGFKYNEDKTHDELGPIDAYFNWKKSGNAGGYNYIGIYGWTVDPLVEYYIVDDWFSEPGPNLLGQRKGEFEVDGATYEVYQNQRNNAPSIKGNQTFPQYFSKRRGARSCGHIDITAHFKKWESLGMKMGKMYEAKVLVEAGGGSGSFDVTYFKMTDKAHPLEEPVSSSSEAPASSAEAPKSSGTVATSSVTTPASSSSAAAPASSSNNAPASSSSAAAPVSSSALVATIGASSSSIPNALPEEAKLFGLAGTYQVFDMQGKFLGKVELKDGSSLKEAVGAKFSRASIYMVKRGGYAKMIAVER